ncbi:MAG TPA: outer membrane lipoprotein carrier protein LolA, partial [Geobacteraceae bacterium]
MLENRGKRNNKAGTRSAGRCFLCSLALVLAALLSAAPAHARSIAPVEGLEALRRVFAPVNDFSAEIIQEKQLALLKRKLVMQGRVRFRKPDLFLMELDPPYASRLVLR